MKSVKPNFLNSWYIKLLRECKKSASLKSNYQRFLLRYEPRISKLEKIFAQSTNLKNVQLEVFERAISIRSQSRKSDYHYSHDQILSRHPIRALILPWVRLSRWIRASGTEKVFLETVDGVKESDDESGQPETISYRRQAFATRLPRLVSRFQFRVSSPPRLTPSASFSSFRETNDQTNFHTLKGRGRFSSRQSPLLYPVLPCRIDPRFDEETIEKIVREGSLEETCLVISVDRSTFPKDRILLRQTQQFSFLFIHLFTFISILSFDFSSRKEEKQVANRSGEKRRDISKRKEQLRPSFWPVTGRVNYERVPLFPTH